MTKNEQIITTENASETQKVALDLAKQISPGTVLALHGDLGSGKTTFTQGLARGLGVQGKIISPTFIIVRTYRNKNLELRIKKLYHIDLYRVESEKDLIGLGLEEIINDSENVVVIEWAERMGEMLPKKRVDIRFEYIDEEKRKITINNSPYALSFPRSFDKLRMVSLVEPKRESTSFLDPRSHSTSSGS